MRYKSGYRYVTTSEEVELLGVWASPIACRPMCIDESSRLRIMPGYAWDGASFLPFLWFGTPSAWLTPSLVHDALYQLIREGLLAREHRAAVDGLFRDLLIERGVWRVVAWAAYYAVRVFGNFAVRKTNPVREVV